MSSSSIDYDTIQFLDPIAYADQIINVNFRWWKPGEIEVGSIWSHCTIGTYSVTWNSTECENWPNKASCEGNMISLNSGYWRIDANSTTILECPNDDACLGGFNLDNDHPVDCSPGYTGILWNEWITEGETKHERISENTCSKCPKFSMNLIRIILVFISFIIFLLLLIR